MNLWGFFGRAPNISNEDSDHNQNSLLNGPLCVFKCFIQCYYYCSKMVIDELKIVFVFGKSEKKQAPVSFSDDEEDEKKQ